MSARARGESTRPQSSTGRSKAVKTGSESQPRPRLAMVMPSWVALR